MKCSVNKALVNAAKRGETSAVFTALLNLSHIGNGSGYQTSAEDVLWSACSTGQLGVVRLLLSLCGDMKVCIHARNERAFRITCEGGHLKLV